MNTKKLLSILLISLFTISTYCMNSEFSAINKRLSDIDSEIKAIKSSGSPKYGKGTYMAAKAEKISKLESEQKNLLQKKQDLEKAKN